MRLSRAPTSSATNPDYEVRVYDDPYFHFKVVRKSTGAVLFDTSLNGGIVLEDQFLQIKTRLATSKIYGFGETRHATFRLPTNVAIPMWAKDEPPGRENGNFYGFHPYYMVVENDGKAHGVLLLTSNGMGELLLPRSLMSVTAWSKNNIFCANLHHFYVSETRLNTIPSLTMKTIGGIVDLYFVLGHSAEEVTQRYTQVRKSSEGFVSYIVHLMFSYMWNISRSIDYALNRYK